MANGIKPTDFPAISGELTGTEELYTQTGGVNEKFTTEFIGDYLGKKLYAEVDLTSEEILNLHTTPKLLLDSTPLGANEYFLIEKTVFEYTYNTAAYLVSDKLGAKNFILTLGADNILSFSSLFISVNNNTYFPKKKYTPLVVLQTGDLSLSLSGGVSDGDGTLKVKIWYTIETFG